MLRKWLLAEQRGNGYILELDGASPLRRVVGRRARRAGRRRRAAVHPFAAGKLAAPAGSRMMERVLADVKVAGYTKILLWVFTDNVRAIRFYEAQGFTFGGRKQPAFGTTEDMYVRAL